MTIDNELYLLRDKLNLTLTEMAKYMGVSYQTYFKWEMGNRVPNASVKKLVEVLGLISTFCPAINDQLIVDAKKNIIEK